MAIDYKDYKHSLGEWIRAVQEEAEDQGFDFDTENFLASEKTARTITMGRFTFKGIPAYAGGDWESPIHFFLCTCEQDEEPAQHFVFIPRPDEGNSAIDLGEPKKKRRRPQTRYVTYGSEHFHWDEEQVKKDYPDLPEALVCPDDAPDPDMDKMWEAFEKVCSEVYEYLMNDTPPVRTCLFGADELIDPEY